MNSTEKQAEKLNELQNTVMNFVKNSVSSLPDGDLKNQYYAELNKMRQENKDIDNLLNEYPL